jgi:hypothetical protein
VLWSIEDGFRDLLRTHCGVWGKRTSAADENVCFGWKADIT